MLGDDEDMRHFRHYIYGIPSVGEEEFLTTKLSEPDAKEFAKKHKAQFKSRFVRYSVRQVDVEVCSVE